MQIALNLAHLDHTRIDVGNISIGLGLASRGLLRGVQLLERIPHIVVIFRPVTQRRTHQHLVQRAHTRIELGRLLRADRVVIVGQVALTRGVQTLGGRTEQASDRDICRTADPGHKRLDDGRHTGQVESLTVELFVTVQQCQLHDGLHARKHGVPVRDCLVLVAGEFIGQPGAGDHIDIGLLHQLGDAVFGGHKIHNVIKTFAQHRISPSLQLGALAKRKTCAVESCEVGPMDLLIPAPDGEEFRLQVVGGQYVPLVHHHGGHIPTVKHDDTLQVALADFV